MYQLFRKMSGKLNEEIGGHNLVATPFGRKSYDLAVSGFKESVLLKVRV